MAYICTLPFLLATLRFKLCMAGLGWTVLDRMRSVTSSAVAISSDWGYGRLSGEQYFSVGLGQR